MSHSRRKFIANSSLLAAGAGLSSLLPLESLAAIQKKISPNEAIQVGLIGCNGMGFSDLSSMLKTGEIQVKALCDVDDSVLQKRTADLEKAGVKKPVTYKDYRKLLDDKDIDVVIIGVPDHWHCLMLTNALEAGKD
ncbi:MAG: Gfo/Idh/MocA family oxidoreductase, partial [Flavisolibacter sp.]|nr:Gfo/Idh/MocA family oxidoreductase [Flavisolibacter sp.]